MFRVMDLGNMRITKLIREPEIDVFYNMETLSWKPYHRRPQIWGKRH